jgi:hypothetical protein
VTRPAATPLDVARETLLRALDELTNSARDLDGPTERADIVVVYSLGRDAGEYWHEVGGWAATAGPKWMHAAMLRRAADAQDDAARALDDDPDQ